MAYSSKAEIDMDLSRREFVNLMAQYHPEYKASDYPEISRRITAQEWGQARAWTKAASLVRIEL
jgi:putative pyruvate formate lyase activating enzyme